MNKFEEKYKEFSNFQLLEVIENKADYNEEAVIAALKEIESRNISEKEKEAFHTKIADDHVKAEQKVKQKEYYLNKIKDIFSFLDQTKPKSIENTVKGTVIMFLLIISYLVIKEFNLFIYSFDALVTGDTFFYYLVAPYLFYLITLYLMWRKNVWGWVFFVIGISLSLITSLSSMYTEITTEPMEGPFANLLPNHGIAYYLVNIIILALILYYYLSRPMRSYFNILKKRK